MTALLKGINKLVLANVYILVDKLQRLEYHPVLMYNQVPP